MAFPRKATPIILALIAASIIFTAPAAAKSDANKFTQVYNSLNGTYTSLQHIAGAHNKWVATHHSMCAQGQAKEWWVPKYTSDVNVVISAEKKLDSISSKTRKANSRTFNDFVKTFTDTVNWMNKKLKPQLLTCHTMPAKSQTVAADLTTIYGDLGNLTY